MWLRINPGFGHGHSQKTNTGGENSKHGIWYADLPQAVEKIRRYDLKLIGVHMHIGSGVDYQHLERVCDAMVQQVIDPVMTSAPFRRRRPVYPVPVRRRGDRYRTLFRFVEPGA